MMKLNIQMFASTNKTANYELPQFVGTDKPTWLGDFNTAMATIDGGMAENKSNIESMDSRVSSAESSASQASQNVSALTTKVDSVESSVSSATTTANNAQSTATTALNTANTANGKADTNASNISNLQTAITNLAPVVLYSNSTGTDGTVTLNDSVSKYSYLEIFAYEVQNGSEIYNKYDVKEGRDLNLSAVTILQNGNLARLESQTYTVSGNKLTVKSGTTGHVTIFTKVINEQSNLGDIRIVKVLGIK